MENKREKQEWRETHLKGEMAATLVFDLLQEARNQVYQIGFETILPGLADPASFIRKSIVGQKITAIPDLFVIDKSGQPHLIEVKFRWDSKWHDNDSKMLELFKKNWEEATIVMVNCSGKPYFRFCQYPFDNKKLVTDSIQNLKPFGITDELIGKFDDIIERYVKKSVMGQ